MRLREPWLLWAYLLLIGAGELLIASAQPVAGLGLHTLLILGLVLHGGLGPDPRARGVALALLLIPLARMLALTLPLAGLPQLAWYPLILATLLVSASFAARAMGLTRVELGLQSPEPLMQLLLAGGGLGFGAVQYLVLPKDSIGQAMTWNNAAFAGLVLLVGLGLTEELMLRGLLQGAALPALGRAAPAYVALLGATLYIGYRSAPALAFAFGTGIILAYITHLSRSVLGVAGAHALANVTAVVLIPFIERQPSPMVALAGYALIAAGAILAALSYLLLFMREAIQRQAPLAQPLTQLRELRRSLGLTYTDLSRCTGIPARFLAEIELGLRPIDPELGRRLEQVLGISFER